MEHSWQQGRLVRTPGATNPTSTGRADCVGLSGAVNQGVTTLPGREASARSRKFSELRCTCERSLGPEGEAERLQALEERRATYSEIRRRPPRIPIVPGQSSKHFLTTEAVAPQEFGASARHSLVEVAKVDRLRNGGTRQGPILHKLPGTLNDHPEFAHVTGPRIVQQLLPDARLEAPAVGSRKVLGQRHHIVWPRCEWQ